MSGEDAPAADYGPASIDKEILGVIRWVCEFDPMSVPPVLERSRQLLLDTLGCAIAGFGASEVKSLAARLAAADTGAIHLPGLAGGFSPSAAAFLIGISACWDEACEGLEAAHGRPGLHAIAAAVPLALAGQASLGELLRAVVVGYEIGGRIGIAYRVRPGMHVDGTWGGFAAVAAAGGLWCLCAEELFGAIDSLACQLPLSLYHPITRGSRARNTYVGHAAAVGLLLGATGADIPGFGGGLAANSELALGRTLGSLAPAPPADHWLILDGYLKKYPAARHVHFGAELAARWHRQRGPGTASIGSIRLRIYREAITYCGNRAPRHAIQAQFSLSYGLACSLRDGTLSTVAYRSETLEDEEVRRLERLVRLEEDLDLTASGRRGATLVIEDERGHWSDGLASIPGDPSHPLGRTELAAKFTELAAPVIGSERAALVIAHILDHPVDRRFAI